MNNQIDKNTKQLADDLMKVISAVITDVDYPAPPIHDDEVIVEHKLWPVSYLSDEGDVVNRLWTFDPTNTLDNRFQVGEPITVKATHVRVELPEGE